MPTYFQRPENALKRANEFIDVGKKEPALEVLCDVIKSKRHRTWQKIHEPIMEKYLSLCVELRKSHIAKEGLYQYKIISQQVNVKSLEDVVRAYLQLAEEKTESARKESEQTVVDIDDLDNLNTPEDLLLCAVSGEDVQARTDRVVLIPWVKFLWESYRQCLDLLRNNNRLELLYQDVAYGAFRFCQKYQRKTEFRKLCDNLRNHLALIQKHQNQPLSINLNSPESQQIHLDTRLFQLETAIHMELWQEAYKAVEDIHNLMEISKKTPKAQLMATYYTKLGLVFWKSGNKLFHACALHRLLQLSREHRKNLSNDEMQRMSSRVLLATLSVPICPPRNDIGDMLDMGNTATDNGRKLAKMLGLQSPPSRPQLINDLLKYNVIPHVLPQLRELFGWLEVDFHPLQICNRISDVLSFLEAGDTDLAQYVPALQTNTLVRLLKQVAQMYDTISVSRIMGLVPFYTTYQIEKTIVESARNGAVQIRLDHSQQMVIFGGELSVSQSGDQQDGGPLVQAMPSEQIRQQLTEMSKALHHALNLIRPTQLVEERKNQKQLIIQNYRRTATKDHQRILLRKQIIEDRKERLETISVQRERQEQDQLEEQQRVQREAEQKRLSREAEDRARRKRKEELQEIQQKHAKERIKTLKQSSVATKMFSKYTEEELEKLDADEIMAKHVEQLEAEKKELQARLKSQEKKIDYFCRAKRVEEIPLLLKQYEEDSKQGKELWDEMESERIEMAQKEREHALAIRDRLKRMTKDKDEFINQLKESRANIYNDKLNKYEEMVKDARASRLMDRKIKRKEERRQKWITEREEEEQKRQDEEAKREREEKQQKEEEEYLERIAKLKEQEDRQAAKMREIEERIEREKMEASRPPRGPPPGEGGPDNWRRGGDEREGGRGPPPPRSGYDGPPASQPWRPRFREESGGGGLGAPRGGREDAWRRDGPPRDGPPRDIPPRDDWRRDGPPRDAGRGPYDRPAGPRRDGDRPQIDRPPREITRPPRDEMPTSRPVEDGPPRRDIERPRREESEPAGRDGDKPAPPRDVDRPAPRDGDRPPPGDEDKPPLSGEGPNGVPSDQAPPPGDEPPKERQPTVSRMGRMAHDIRKDEPDFGREFEARRAEARERDLKENEARRAAGEPPGEDGPPPPDNRGGWGRDQDYGRDDRRDDFRRGDRGGYGGGRDRDFRRRDDWGRGGDDRGPPRRVEGAPRQQDEGGNWRGGDRSDPRAGGYRDGPREPPRDAWRDNRGPRRDDGGPDQGDDRGPRRDEDRGPRRDDGPRRDEGPRRIDRGPRQDDQNAWRRDDAGGRPPPRGQDGGAWRDRGEPPARREPPSQERGEPPARERGEPPAREIPRKREEPEQEAPPKPPPAEVDEDGWTTVRR